MWSKGFGQVFGNPYIGFHLLNPLLEMKHIRPYFLLICCMVVLLWTGCEVNESIPNPKNPDTVAETGFITAGETGDRFIVWDFRDSPRGVWSGENRSFVLDTATNVAMSLSYSYSSSQGSSYASTSLGSSDSRLEMSLETILDTSWVCYAVNSDTTDGSITHYNGYAHIQCGGQRYLENLDSIVMPKPYIVGTRIDSSLAWRPGGGSLNMWNQYYTITGGWGYPEVSYRKVYDIWEGLAGTNFVGIRLREGTGFRYGYMELEARHGWALVHRIVLER